MNIVLLWLKTHPKHAAAILILVVALAVVGGFYLKGRHDAAAHAKAERQVEVAEALKSDEKAKVKVDAQRVIDAESDAELKKELTDAVAKVPDDVPDAVAVQLGCQRLRNAGIRTADLPACR